MTAPASAPLRTRIDGLTSLRFFAALAVVLCHIGIITQGSPHEWFTKSGYLAVSFFFILSGFVLTWSWRPTRARFFIARRLSRIWPLHAILWCLVILTFPERRGTLGQQLSGLGLVQMWGLPSPDPTFFTISNDVAWTLSCELAFYLALPFVAPRVLRAGRAQLVALAVATVGAAYVGRDLILAYVPNPAEALLHGPIYRFHEFFLGVLIAAFMRTGIQLQLRTWPCVLAIVTGYVLVSTGVVWQPGYPANGAMLLPFAALIAAVAGQLGQKSILNHRWLVARGDASFALYLVHFPIVLALGKVATGHPLQTRLELGAAGLVLALVAAEVAHRWVELPVEQVLRRRIKAAETRQLATALARRNTRARPAA